MKLDLSPFGFFEYNAFSVLESSQDPHLFEYFYLPKTLSISLLSTPAFIYAVPGSGKTALRIYSSQEILDISGHFFPITYLVDPDQSLLEYGNHDKSLLRVLAEDTLLRIFEYPFIFLNIQPQTRTEIIQFLWSYLPVDLSFILQTLSDTTKNDNIAIVAGMIGRPSLSSKGISDTSQQQEALTILREASPNYGSNKNWSFEDALEMIMHAWGAKEAFLFFDGIDNITSNKGNPVQASEWIWPIIEKASEWAEKHIFLKAFLTADMKKMLEPKMREKGIHIPAADLCWDEKQLAELLRLRVAASSRNRINSLIPISSMELRDTEGKLVQTLPANRRLPRELMVLTQFCLRSALSRHYDSRPLVIMPNDIDQARKDYLSLRHHR